VLPSMVLTLLFKTSSPDLLAPHVRHDRHRLRWRDQAFIRNRALPDKLPDRQDCTQNAQRVTTASIMPLPFSSERTRARM